MPIDGRYDGVRVVWILVASPDRGDWNILFSAICIAFTAGLLTPHGMLFGMLGGAGFIIWYLLKVFQPDPSGLGPLELVMPIQLGLAAIPMALAAWIGGLIRARFSRRP